MNGLNLVYTFRQISPVSWTVTCPSLLIAQQGQLLKLHLLNSTSVDAPELFANEVPPDGLLAKMSWAGDVPTRQPLVYTDTCDMKCTNGTVQNSTGVFYMSCQPAYEPCSFEVNFTSSIASWLADQDWNNGFFTFVDLRESLPNVTSTAAIAGKLGASDEGYQYSLMIFKFVCVWADSYPAYGDIGTNYTSLFFAARPGTLLQSLEDSTQVEAASVIDVDAEWMNSLLSLVPFPFSNSSVAEIVMSYELFLILPIMIASTMAAVPCSFNICTEYLEYPQAFGTIDYNYSRQLTAEEASLPGNHVIQRAQLFANITAYRFYNSWLVILGFVLVYLHIALVFAHFAIIATGGFWMSTAWSNMGDFLALAIRSPPGHSAALLADVDAGVASSRTWGLMVRVHKGEGQEKGQVEMVLDDPSSHNYGEAP